MGGTLGSAFVALAVVAPGMLLQDSWRFAFFAAGQGHKAFVNDVVWAVTMIPLLFLAAMHGAVWVFVLAWGGASLLAAGCGWLQSGIVPHFTGVRDWLRQHKDLGSRYLVENVSNSGASQLRMYGLGAIAGLADVGAIRGAELLLGPFLALLMGLNLVAVPEAARVLRRAPSKLARFCLVLGGAQAVAAAAWGSGAVPGPGLRSAASCSTTCGRRRPTDPARVAVGHRRWPRRRRGGRPACAGRGTQKPACPAVPVRRLSRLRPHRRRARRRRRHELGLHDRHVAGRRPVVAATSARRCASTPHYPNKNPWK